MSEHAAPPPTPIESWEVLDLLTSLVQKSLVVYEEDEQGQGRYRLLETVRQYARDRLLEAGEGEAVRGRHGDWFLALAEEAEPEIARLHRREWLDRLEREYENLRAALERCLETEEGAEPGLRLVAALTWFWVGRGHLEEGWQSTTRALAAGSGAPAAARGKALAGAMGVGLFRDDYPAQAALAEEGLALGRASGDRWLTAVSLYYSAGASLFTVDRDRAVGLAEEALALGRELEDGWLMAIATQVLGHAVWARGDHGRAITLHQESLDHFRELENTGGIAAQLLNLGWFAWQEGNPERARALYSEGLAVMRGTGDRSSNFFAGLHILADLALLQGDYDTARRCYEEALAIAREMNDQPRAADALLGLARVAHAAGDPRTARALLGEAQALGEGAGDPMSQGHLLLELGDPAAARCCYEEGLALRRARGDAGGMAWALLGTGHAAWLQGEPAVTQSHAAEALGIFQERADREGVLAVLEGLAVAALAQGQKGRAARLMGAVEALPGALGLSGPDWRRRPRERIAEAVRAASLEQECAAAWAQGRAMSLEEAVAFAQEQERATDERD